MEFALSILSLLIRGVLGNLELLVMFGAFYIMTYMVKRRANILGLDVSIVADLSFWVAVGAVVGGRLAYILPSMQSYLTHPFDLIRINGGMYFYGALIGALIAGGWFAWRKNLSLWSIADMYGLYAPLAVALTRFGCLAVNRCYGAQADPPLGLLFPGLTQSRYPSELYEGLLSLVVFGGLLWLTQRKTRKGTLFLVFLIAYPLARALIDVTRINIGSPVEVIDPIISLGVAVLATIVLIVRQGGHRDKIVDARQFQHKQGEVFRP